MKPKIPKLLLSALILITLDLAVAGYSKPAEAGPGFDAVWWAFNTVRNYRFGDINRDLDRLEWRMRQQSSENASPKPASNRGYRPKPQGYTALSQATTSPPQNRRRQRLYRARGYGTRHHVSRFRRF